MSIKRKKFRNVKGYFEWQRADGTGRRTEDRGREKKREGQIFGPSLLLLLLQFKH
jgi:hypothetical protein